MTRTLAIFGETEPDELVRLRLVRGSDVDDIRLVVVDKDGGQVHCGNLLKITSKGVYFFSNVNPSLGFKLYKDNRLREVS